jgi:hypothetical protein
MQCLAVGHLDHTLIPGPMQPLKTQHRQAHITVRTEAGQTILLVRSKAKAVAANRDMSLSMLRFEGLHSHHARFRVLTLITSENTLLTLEMSCQCMQCLAVGHLEYGGWADHPPRAE